MNYADAVIGLSWLLLSVRNKAALLPLFVHLVFVLSFLSFTTNFPIFCITAIALIQVSKVNINVSSEIRYALIGLACIYLVGAIDEVLYYQVATYSGDYLELMKYLVIAIDLRIACLLFREGRGDLAGFIDDCRALARNCLHRLYGLQFVQKSKGHERGGN